MKRAAWLSVVTVLLGRDSHLVQEDGSSLRHKKRVLNIMVFGCQDRCKPGRAICAELNSRGLWRRYVTHWHNLISWSLNIA